MINGQFPGPTIEANWGDTIQVTVHNQIAGPEEGTSLHWHGILQKKSPWMDGVPGIQQCPISPGGSFTYSFQADLYGTSWYHSHYSAQYADGLLGPMIIHGPIDNTMGYDIDLGPVLLTDHYHQPYMTIVEGLMSNGSDLQIAPPSDNNLINGKGNFDCSTVANGDTTKCTKNAGLAQFKFTSGKTHRLRLINAGAEGLQRFSIDGHTLTVIANDFVPITPYTTKVVTLGIGQRTDILVTANVNTPTSSYWMRSNISSICSVSNQPHALAEIYYESADTTKQPSSTAWNIPDPGTCSNDALSTTIPAYKITPSQPTITKTMEINFGFNSTGHFLWTLDGTSFRADYNSPIYLLSLLGNTQWEPQWNVKNFSTNSTIRIIVNNLTPVAHPMHLHGHNMQILNEGTGTWDGHSITNSANPQRRDVQMLRPNGYLVLQFDADNPGVWPFHCHIAWHVSGGLYASLLERPADLLGVSVPSVLAQTCRDWAAWSGVDVVDMIDSGL